MPLVRISSLSLTPFPSQVSPKKHNSQIRFSGNGYSGHYMTRHETCGKLESYKPPTQVNSIKDMQLTLPFLLETLPQTAPDMRTGEVHAVLTENQRGHHYLEGLDLLAWGGCHLGLSLQLDSSDTTLLLRTGTGRAWNVSGRKCIDQDMRTPYLLREREGVFFEQPHPTEDFQTVQTPYTEAVLLWVAGLETLALVPRVKLHTLPWLKSSKELSPLTQKFLMQSFPPEISIRSFWL